MERIDRRFQASFPPFADTLPGHDHHDHEDQKNEPDSGLARTLASISPHLRLLPTRTRRIRTASRTTGSRSGSGSILPWASTSSLSGRPIPSGSSRSALTSRAPACAIRTVRPRRAARCPLRCPCGPVAAARSRRTLLLSLCGERAQT